MARGKMALEHRHTWSNPGFYGSVIIIFCVRFWFLCSLCFSVFARLLDFADSLGLTALDFSCGTEVRFLTFFDWLCNVNCVTVEKHRVEKQF